MGAVFDYNKDGVLDFVIADGNDSRYYYVFKNGLANVYFQWALPAEQGVA